MVVDVLQPTDDDLHADGVTKADTPAIPAQNTKHLIIVTDAPPLGNRKLCPLSSRYKIDDVHFARAALLPVSHGGVGWPTLARGKGGTQIYYFTTTQNIENRGEDERAAPSATTICPLPPRRPPPSKTTNAAQERQN